SMRSPTPCRSVSTRSAACGAAGRSAKRLARSGMDCLLARGRRRFDRKFRSTRPSGAFILPLRRARLRSGTPRRFGDLRGIAMVKSISVAGAIGFVALILAGAAQAGPTLDRVKTKDVVTCGVSTGVAGFSMADTQGKYNGLSVDFCRQLAAAVL